MKKNLLGELVFVKEKKEFAKKTLQKLKSFPVQKASKEEIEHWIGTTLLAMVKEAPLGSFLLPEVIEVIGEIRKLKWLDGYTFSMFELWLLQFSGLSEEERLQVRGKIVGRFIPREAYQPLFPIGSGKKFPGPHFVTAHASPDLDTTVASFWGWVDAFGCGVGTHLHVWNVPGGLPAIVETPLLFHAFFGEEMFPILGKDRTALSVTCAELLSQEGLHKQNENLSLESLGEISAGKAVVIVDSEGHYLGELQGREVEEIRFVFSLIRAVLTTFESSLQTEFLRCARQGDDGVTIEKLFDSLFASSIDSFVTQRLSEGGTFSVQRGFRLGARNLRLVEEFLQKVLHLKNGIASSVESFLEALRAETLLSLKKRGKEFSSNEGSKRGEVFDKLRSFLERLSSGIDEAFSKMDLLRWSLQVKQEVLSTSASDVGRYTNLEELRDRIGDLPYLTVTDSAAKDKKWVVGIVHAHDVHRSSIGTVTLRDFCNRDETKIPSYLEIISSIDHHKVSLATHQPIVATLTDAQSVNSVVAEKSFLLSERYSTAGLSLEQIEKQMEEISKQGMKDSSSRRILGRLLKKLEAISTRGSYFVSPEREKIEYLHYLYAILDDTDLFSKASIRDLEAAASLVNRLATLVSSKEVEVIHFDEIPLDGKFLEKGIAKLLQSEEMFSLYKTLYEEKERGVDLAIEQIKKGDGSLFFADTKEQNGTSRVGQTKLFARNFSPFLKASEEVQSLWLNKAKEIFKGRVEISFHLHMISTIVGAQEVYTGKSLYNHLDEIWIWVPESEEGASYLRSFLSTFGSALHTQKNVKRVWVEGSSSFYAQLLKESPLARFFEGGREDSKKESFIKIEVAAGSMNSRKSMISPYLVKR